MLESSAFTSNNANIVTAINEFCPKLITVFITLLPCKLYTL